MKKTIVLISLLFVVPTSALAQATGASDGRATFHEIPQVVFGSFPDGSYYEFTLMVTNWTSATGVSCAVETKGATPTFVDIVGGESASSFNFGLIPFGWAVYKVFGTVPLQTGALTVNCSSEVTAQVIYSYYAADGEKLAEATVFSSPRGNMLQVTMDQRGNVRLGIAVFNSSNVDQQIQINVYDPTFDVIVSHSQTLSMMTKIALFVDELPGAEIPPDFVGTVMVMADSGQVLSMIGLRQTGSTLFTTIPSTVMNQVP